MNSCPTRPERAEAPSPGQRPGLLWTQTCRPVRAKALKYWAIYKAFALTGRLTDCYYTQGDALSGRVGQNMRKFSKEVYGNYSFASYLNILTRKRLYTRSFLKDSGKRSERNWKAGAPAGDTRYFTSCLNFTFRLWLAKIRFVASLPEPIYTAFSS